VLVEGNYEFNVHTLRSVTKVWSK